MRRLPILLGYMLLFLLVMAVRTDAMTLEWKVYETEHFAIYFPAGYQYPAQETAYYLETLLPRVEKLTGNDRREKIRILIQDVGMDSNGYTEPVSGKIGIFTNGPTSGGSLSAYQSWSRLVSGHELTHMYHLTNYSGAGAVLPFLFGNVMAGNMAVPGWLVEGITVYAESTINPYEGRMNDGYYDALIAAKAKEGKLPDILAAGYPHATYPAGQWYLYGGAFVRYLAATYGEEKLARLFDLHGSNLLGMIGAVVPAVGLDRAAKKVFGKSFPVLYREWVESEMKEHRDWKTDGAPVLADKERGYYSDLNAYRGKLYSIRRKVLTPGPHMTASDVSLVEWNPVTGEERVLMRVADVSEARMQIVNNRIYLMAAEMTGGFANVDRRGLGETGVLYSYDLGTGATNRLLTDVVKAFGVMPNGEIICFKPRREAFGAEVWRFTGQEMEQLGVIDQAVGEVQWYKDRFIVVGKTRLGSWNIQQFDLQSLALTPLVNTPAAEFGIALEGDQLYYTANYDREYAIYRYNLANGEVSRVTEGNFAMNGAVIGNDLYFRAVTADGDVIRKTAISPKPYVLGEGEAAEEDGFKAFAAGLQEMSAARTSYLNLLKPYNRLFPSLLAGEDGLGLNRYTVSYSQFRGLDLNLQIGELMPLEIGLSNRKVNSGGGRETVLTANYPLHTSTQYGLTAVSLSGQTNFSGYTVGALGATIRLPRQRIDLTVRGALDGGRAAGMEYSYALDRGMIRVRANTFERFDTLTDVRGMGYFGGQDVSGTTLSFDVTHKLLEIRKGFWNTSLFVADLYGNLFVDQTSLGGGQSSVGAELIVEMGAGFGAVLLPKVGVAYSGQLGVRPVLGLDLSF